MGNPWVDEIWRALGVALLSLLLGAAAGQIAAFLLGGALIYLGWHLLNLYRFENWLRTRSDAEPPQATGIWGEIYHHFYLLLKKQREGRRKLATMLDRFQEAASAMPDATVVMRTGGEIEWLNNSAERLLGLKPDEDVGQKITNLIRHSTFVTYLARADFTEPAEFPSPANEALYLQVHIVPYGKGRLLLVARDVTRLHKLEQMRRDFVANVSHELRTPLTVISGFLETLGDEAQVDDALMKQWGESLGLMQEQSRRMQSIVEDLLLLAKLEASTSSPPRDPVSVPSLIAGVAEDARPLLAEKDQTLTTQVDDSLWLHGNEQQLRSALSNLVFNAIRYTPAGGRIEVHWLGDAGGARLEVVDNGIGIAPQHIPRLTERFYRVDVGRSRETGGTGLGLAIVKHVLNRHDATLEIESELDKGSTFSCVFPRHIVFQREASAA